MNFMYLRTKKNPDVVWFSLILIFFAFVAALYMGPSFLHPSSVVLGQPGDHTSGIMYLSWAHPGSPIPHRSMMTNYPEGESLRIPTTASSQVLSISHWTASLLSNVVLGWNIMVFVGFMLSALVMFGFIRWLTQDIWISFFSAYAFAFTPYHVFASRGQIAGLYGFVFVAIFWQFLILWSRPTLKRSVLLGLTFGLSFYMDGYFILIGFVTLLAMWLATITYSRLFTKESFRKQKQKLMALSVSTITVLLSISPLLWVQYRYSNQISVVLGSARGDVLSNAQAYSAKISMYLSPMHILYVGLPLVALAFWGLITHWIAIRRSPQRDKSKTMQYFAWWSSLILVLLGLWVSLAPVSHLFGFTIYNPSRLIIALTPTWRVFGRLYSIVVVGTITLSALGLQSLLKKYATRSGLIKFGLSLILILDMSIYPLLSQAGSFDYKHAPPPVYAWLAREKSPHVLAEYPIDDTMQGPYIADYLTFQKVSNTPIVNSFLPNNSRMLLRRSIAGVNDLQTLPVLRALGVDMINVHAHNQIPLGYSGYQEAPYNPALAAIFTDQKDIYSFIIKPGSIAKHALVVSSPQLFQTKIEKAGKSTLHFDTDLALAVVALSQEKNASSLTAGLSIAATEPCNLLVTQNGRAIWSGRASQFARSIEFNVSPNYPINIYHERGSRPNSIAVSDLYVFD